VSFQNDAYQIADELRTIASLGLRYAENTYDKERYEKTLALSARLVASIESRPADDVMREYEENLSHVSPYLGADAAVFRGDSLLLIRREDNGLWAMRGGLVHVGESWAVAAVRELREESGVVGKAVRLMGIFDSRAWGGIRKSQIYIAPFEVKAAEAEPIAGPETTDVGFFPEDGLPALSPGHQFRVPLVFKQRRGEASIPHFDTAERAGPGSEG